MSAVGLNVSWSLHNVIAWMKSKPFYSRNVSMAYIASVVAVQPYWLLEIYANFAYFNNINRVFEVTRPMEPFFRFVMTPSPAVPVPIPVVLRIGRPRRTEHGANRIKVTRGGYSQPALCSTRSNAGTASASSSWSPSARDSASCWLRCVSRPCSSLSTHAVSLV